MNYVHVPRAASVQGSSCMDSNVYLLGINNPDLYLMLRLFLVIFVKNAHSIIRSKTSDSDTIEQM